MTDYKDEYEQPVSSEDPREEGRADTIESSETSEGKNGGRTSGIQEAPSPKSDGEETQPSPSDAELRRRIIKRTLAILKAQTSSPLAKTEGDDIWLAWGAWQLWEEQLNRLKEAMGEAEKREYKDDLDTIEDNIKKAKTQLIEYASGEITEVVNKAVKGAVGQEMQSLLSGLEDKVLKETQALVDAQGDLSRKIEDLKNATKRWKPEELAEKIAINLAQKQQTEGKRLAWIGSCLSVGAFGIVLVLLGVILWRVWHFPVIGPGSTPTAVATAVTTAPTALPTVLTLTTPPPTNTPAPTPTPTPATPTIDRVAALLSNPDMTPPPIETPPPDSKVNATIGFMRFTADTLAGVTPDPAIPISGPWEVTDKATESEAQVWVMTVNGQEPVSAASKGNFGTFSSLGDIGDIQEAYLCAALKPGAEPQPGWGVTVRWNQNQDRAFLGLPGAQEITCARVGVEKWTWNFNFVAPPAGEGVTEGATDGQQTQPETVDLTRYQWWLVPVPAATPTPQPGQGGG